MMAVWGGCDSWHVCRRRWEEAKGESGVDVCLEKKINLSDDDFVVEKTATEEAFVFVYGAVDIDPP